MYDHRSVFQGTREGGLRRRNLPIRRTDAGQSLAMTNAIAAPKTKKDQPSLALVQDSLR
jgi:hypothetical protein